MGEVYRARDAKLDLNGAFLLIALPVGWLAWLRLRRIAASCEAKRFSDAQLLARMWWLMLVVTIGFDILIGRGRPGLASGWLQSIVLPIPTAGFASTSSAAATQAGRRRWSS